jgi:hypothetical protein
MGGDPEWRWLTAAGGDRVFAEMIASRLLRKRTP